MYNLPLHALPPAAVQPGYAPCDAEIQAALAALRLFERACRRGQSRRAWSFLRRQPNDLLTLRDVQATTAIHNGYSAGVRVVPIREIRGSEGRSADFDRTFSPLQERSRGRWLRIATAQLQGATLPPVALIQIGGVYFVRDGHHRVSVARALGQEYVDAEVTVWVQAEQPAPACCLKPRSACAA
jgi:hypothetical protein